MVSRDEGRPRSSVGLARTTLPLRADGVCGRRGGDVRLRVVFYKTSKQQILD